MSFPSPAYLLPSHTLLLQSAGREGGNLLVEKLLGADPDGGVLAVVEGEERGEEVNWFGLAQQESNDDDGEGNVRLKASEASRGSSEGRWSMEMTEMGGAAWRPSTGTVGLSKVVATV